MCKCCSHKMVVIQKFSLAFSVILVTSEIPQPDKQTWHCNRPYTHVPFKYDIMFMHQQLQTQQLCETVRFYLTNNVCKICMIRNPWNKQVHFRSMFKNFVSLSIHINIFPKKKKNQFFLPYKISAKIIGLLHSYFTL